MKIARGKNSTVLVGSKVVMYDRGAYEESYVHSSTGKGGVGGRFQMPEISFQSKWVGYVGGGGVLQHR